ncbi:MAG: phage Gp37/Gp68 family protein [Candidatus Aenigmatarchaeota archaeon]
MAFKSLIEWTEATWNPTTGCSKISLGCKNCYAERIALRLQAAGNPKYKNGFKLTLHYDEINKPLFWKESKLIFVNSMSDLFHEDIPFSFIQKIFQTMNKAYWHIFQVLTKRSKRLKELAPLLSWTPNIWIGVTVETSSYLYRIDDLLEVPTSSIKFLSLEPLLEEVRGLEDYLKTGHINWVIVGGESGPHARPIKKDWVKKIKNLCERYGVAFFFKQWGGKNKKESGRLLDGVEYLQLPPFKKVNKINQKALFSA